MLHRLTGSDVFRGSISTVEEKLRPYGFARIHRSLLSNTLFVEEIQPRATGDYVLRIRGGKEFAVSRTYKRNLHAITPLWFGSDRFGVNPPAVRSVLPRTIKKTDLVLVGRSKAQISEAISTAIDKKELPRVESGAMCYMFSKQSYLNDRDGHWHPHLMFFVPLTDPESWGANQPGSPLIGVKFETDRLTLFLLPVGAWSDATPAPLPQS